MKQCNDSWMWRLLQSAALLAVLVALLGMRIDVVRADSCPTTLLISEYVEGSGNNKAIEVYNGTGAEIDLAGYRLTLYTNGNTTPQSTYDFSGTLADGATFVVANSSADSEISAVADDTSGVAFFNGNDALVLTYNSTVIDSIGDVGNNAAWGAEVTLVRKSSVIVGDTVENDDFTTADWDSYAQNTFTYLGSHTMDACGSGGANNLSITKVAAPTVNVDINDLVTYTVVISNSSTLSDTHALFTDTLPTEVDFAYWVTQPSGTNLANDELTWQGNVTNSHKITFTFAVTNLVKGIPVENTAEFSATSTGSASASYVAALACDMSTATTCIHLIQGDNDNSNMQGDSVTVEGIVVGVFPDLDGFFVQEEDSDTDDSPATSEGIFVYLDTASITVNVGDKVQVTGTVNEYYNNTQLSNATVTAAGTDTVPTPTALTLPFASSEYAERWEGMLIRNTQPLSVTEIYLLGRYGQVLLSAGRLMQGTQAALPGAAALAIEAENALNEIILDDGDTTQNPATIIHPSPELSADHTLRGGDTITNILGVVNYANNAYRIQPTNTPTYIPSNPRPTTLQTTGDLTIASFNVLNYFDTFSGCTGGVGGSTMSCRGAEDAIEFTRQRDKIIAAMVAIDADIFGLMEIENDGYANGNSAIDDLVDGLNAVAGAGTYAYNDVDAATGDTNALGTDAIKVDMIYKPATVNLVGTTVALDYGDSKNRVSLIQSFQDNASGEIFTVIVNHFKSKGSSCDSIGDPDTGDGQGNCNLTRTYAATTLSDTLATDPTGVNDPDYLIIGDLNSYGKEDPITSLEAAGYTDMVEHFGGLYGYVFSGRWGTLDYALASSSLITQINRTEAWHINADEPISLDYNTNYKSDEHIISLYQPDMYRASDHDPVVVSLYFGPNTAPVALNDAYTTSENIPLHITAPGVLANDSDAEAHLLTVALDSAPTHGNLALNPDGAFTYTPTQGYAGADFFTYHANDGQANSNSATVTLTITALSNTAPTIADIDDQATLVNTPISVTFTISDTTDPVADLWVYAKSSNLTLVNGGLAGTLMLGTGMSVGCADAVCTLWITPTTDITGTTTITVTVDDNLLTDSDSFVLTVTAAPPPNTPPTISNITNQTTTAGTAITVSFIISDVETASDDLALSTASSNLTLLPLSNIVLGGSGTQRTATLMPVANLTGTAMVTLTVSDGELTAADSFVLAVGDVNVPPEFTSTPVITGTVEELYTYNVVATDLNVDDTLTIAATTTPAWLTLTDNGNGTATLTGTPTIAGTFDVVLTVSDGTDTATQAFTITVAAVPPLNQPPTISNITNQTTTVGTAITVSFIISDVETASDDLALSTASSNLTLLPLSNIVLGGSGTQRTATLMPVANLTGTAMITLTVSDGKLDAYDSFVLAVGDTNVPPEFTSAPVTDGTVDIPYTYNITATDLNADTLVITTTTKPAWLTLTDNGNGTATLTGTPTIAGTFDVVLTVSDGTDTATQAFTITVNKIPCTPVTTVALTYTPQGDLFPGDMLRLSAQPDGDAPYTFTWTIDGQTLPGINQNAIQHTFNTTGTHNVAVSVSNPCGTIAAEQNILIQEAPPEEVPDLSFSFATVNPRNVTIGERLTYTLILHNHSNITATAILSDPRPLNTTYVLGSDNATTGQITMEAERLLWQGEVISGTPVMIGFSVIFTTTAPPVGTPIVNTAQLNDGYGKIITLTTQAVYNPGYNFSINYGDRYTNQDVVTLTYQYAEAGITQVKFSNDGGFGNTKWENVATNRIKDGWILDTYGDAIIPRTVYILFRDAAGQQYGPFNDDIVYDPIKPQLLGVEIITTTQHVARVMATQAVTVRVTANDDNSGVAWLQLSATESFTASPQIPLTDQITDIAWNLPASGTLYARVIDRAGNISAVRTPPGTEKQYIFLPLVLRNSP